MFFFYPAQSNHSLFQSLLFCWRALNEYPDQASKVDHLFCPQTSFNSFGRIFTYQQKFKIKSAYSCIRTSCYSAMANRNVPDIRHWAFFSFYMETKGKVVLVAKRKTKAQSTVRTTCRENRVSEEEAKCFDRGLRWFEDFYREIPEKCEFS